MGRWRFALCFVLAGIFSISSAGVSLAADLSKRKDFAVDVLDLGQRSAYPPAFLGSEWAFGFALFSLIIISALAVRHMIIIATYMLEYREPMGSPITINRLIIMSLLMTIVIATAPDAILLLAWGEVDLSSITFIAKAGRVLDGLTVLPFSVAVFLMIRGEDMLHDQLLRPPVTTDMWPTFASVKHHVGLIALVVTMALGVTLGK